MARKTILVCDNCSSEVAENRGASMRINYTDARRGSKQADLCDDCAGKMPGQQVARRLPDFERARERAAAEHLPMEFQEADAEALPFPDASFDAVVSTFGVMFTPDQERAAAELVRVCKGGGKIGLANWTPEGFIGQLFKTIGKHVAPPPGARSPALWGDRARIGELFVGHASSVKSAQRHFVFRYRSPLHWLEVFKTYYGPVLKTFAALSPEAQAALQRDLLELVARFNRSNDGTMVVPSEYLEIVITRN